VIEVRGILASRSTDDRIETIAGSGGPLSVTTFRWGVP